MNRREFLKYSSAGLAAGSFLGSSSLALSSPRFSKRLAVISLQGGMDGLAAVPPLGDKFLFDQRPDLIGSEIFEINQEFGLSQSMPHYFRLLQNNEASIVHASAFPYTKRSHFEGQNVIQSGVKTPFGEKTGWLGRTLAKVGLSGRALSVDKPLLLRGYNDIETVYPAHIAGSNDLDASLINELMTTSSYGPLTESLEKIAKSINLGMLNIPRDPKTLAFTAGQAMSRGDGPVVSFVEVGGFDTHAQQGINQKGAQSRKLAELDNIIDAYRKGLGEKWQDTAIITVTEFGRTVKMNGSSGTDHGYGSATFLAGGLVGKGAVVADWPSLKSGNLFEGRDLLATIDSRSLWCAVLNRVFDIDHGTLRDEVFFDNAIPDLSEYLFS